jgi:signal peptide peptidase SppA
MSQSQHRLLLHALDAPWACLPEHHALVCSLVEGWIRGDRVDLGELQARRGEPLPGPSRGYEVRDGVAIIPVMGTMAPRANLMADVSGGVSSELLVRDVRAAAADPKVKALILQIDSPGGAVAGTPAAASAVMAVRGVKPVAALVEGTMASAAYWVGSAAESVRLSSRVDLAGSIGVRMVHRDISQAKAAAGVTDTEIVAGRFKNAGSDNGPLSESGREILQGRVDAIYSEFVGDVARQRGRSVAQVLADMADGRVFVGQQAVDAGLADGFASLDDLVAEMKDRAKWRRI